NGAQAEHASFAHYLALLPHDRERLAALDFPAGGAVLHLLHRFPRFKPPHPQRNIAAKMLLFWLCVCATRSPEMQCHASCDFGTGRSGRQSANDGKCVVASM
ncbi:hypothetical protein J3B02_006439, partial [Coemansia erecta]